jgi:hypothetical protein
MSFWSAFLFSSVRYLHFGSTRIFQHDYLSLIFVGKADDFVGTSHTKFA